MTQIPPPSEVRLGKHAPRIDPRTLRMASYATIALPSPPAEIVPPSVPAWGMMRNDILGDCTCAACGHLVMNWTALEKHETIPTDDDVVNLYNRVNGGADDGAACLDVLAEWRRNGLGADKIAAFVAVNPQNEQEVTTALWLFGGVYIGIALPLSAQGQGVWEIPTQPHASPAPGSWGGHAVVVVGVNAIGPIVVTWGQLMQVSWAFWGVYVDEAYAILAPEDWAGDVPGFNLDQLRADLAALPA